MSAAVSGGTTINFSLPEGVEVRRRRSVDGSITIDVVDCAGLDVKRLAILNEAGELFTKTLAVSSCLTYARKEITDDESGETLDGSIRIISDNLRRLQQLVGELGALA